MRRLLLAAALVPLLAACQQTVETRVTSSGAAAVSPGAVRFVALREDAGADEQAANAAVRAAMLASGFTETGDAPVLAEVAIAQRPVKLGLTAEGKPLPPGKKGDRKGCVTSDYRLVVVLSSLTDGARPLRASAEETHCGASWAALAPELAKAALAELTAPGGEKIVERLR